MTENERLTIDEIIQHCNRTCENTEMLAIARGQNQEDITSKGYWEHYQVANYLEELKQYRAIGTVEEIQKKMEELDRWHTDKINENIKNPFAYTSTLICHNCDHKDDYIEELEAEVEEYKSIGTIEEFKALKEKNTPKKVAYQVEHEKCPTCGSFHVFGKHCTECGQAVDYD